ncbi:MAG TPA: Crp/Fnr family transcriptional regulator [Gemmatimonadales bacterium]|nr:Crp/Fnr family transcriptional regulator [Gemmatimonadales bacterium]
MTNLETPQLFADLTAVQLGHLNGFMRRKRFAKGTLIHAAGVMGADLFLIEMGRVTIQLASDDGHALTVRMLWPGDFFGEVSLLDDEAWYGDAVAFDDCTLRLLSKPEFLHLLETHPAVSRRLLTIICRRLRHNAEFARDLAFLNVPTRLARTLIALTEPSGWGWSDGAAAERTGGRELELTQAALAAHVGATRESINKWLAYYERSGCISRKRDRIAILRCDELRKHAQLDS